MKLESPRVGEEFSLANPGGLRERGRSRVRDRDDL
jgi:hypothetical protein